MEDAPERLPPALLPLAWEAVLARRDKIYYLHDLGTGQTRVIEGIPALIAALRARPAKGAGPESS